MTRGSRGGRRSPAGRRWVAGAVGLMGWVGVVTGAPADVLLVPDDYPTIQDAIDDALPGDVVKVNPSGSPYPECVLIDVDELLVVAGGAVQIIDPGVPTGPCRDIVKIGAKAVRFQGFEIDGDQTTKNGIRAVANDVQILTNFVHDVTQNGIVVGQPSGPSSVLTHITVANNTVLRAGFVAPELEPTVTCLGPCGPSVVYHGILVNLKTTGVTVYGNVVSEASGDGINVKSPGNVIDANVVIWNGDDGLDIDKKTAKNNKITNNVGLGNGDWDFERYTAATPLTFTGNVFPSICTTCNGPTD